MDKEVMAGENTVTKGANVPRRRALGRGLSALMESTLVGVRVNEEEKEAATTQRNKVVEHPLVSERKEGPELEFVAIDRLEANAGQPRKQFQAAEIDELSRSIKETGLLQPLIVRPGRSGYQIIAGERRFRAAKQAGLNKLPVIVRELSEREALEVGIIENIQRSDLNPVEEAEAYARLVSEFGASQEEVARSVGKDRASIANSMRLLKLSEPVLAALINGEISAGHGRALLGVENKELQLALAKEVTEKKLSVRELERRVREGGSEKLKSKKRRLITADKQKSADVLHVEEQLRRELGTKVNLNLSEKGSGELRIQFFSIDELEQLLERFKVSI